MQEKGAKARRIREAALECGRMAYLINQHKIKIVHMFIVQMGVLLFVMFTPELLKVLGFQPIGLVEVGKILKTKVPSFLRIMLLIDSLFSLFRVVKIYSDYEPGAKGEKSAFIFERIAYFIAALTMGIVLMGSTNAFSILLIRLGIYHMIQFAFWILGKLLNYSWQGESCGGRSRVREL